MFLSEIVTFLGLQQANQPVRNPRISRLQLDSRQIKPGDCFLAYPGFVSDGRDYIKDAILNGAVAVLYEPSEIFQDIDGAVPCIPIPDLSSKVSHIAGFFYTHPSTYLTMVGITGTNGKTSCSHFIAQLLNDYHISASVIGSNGYGAINQLTPLTLTTPSPIEMQRILAEFVEQNKQAAVIELSSHALIQKRAANVSIDIAVYTNLSPEHLDYHHTMESYAEAKALIFKQSRVKHAVINLDDDYGQYFVEKLLHSDINIWGYTLQKPSLIPTISSSIKTISASDIVLHGQGCEATINTPWGAGQLQSQLLGKFNVSNLLASITVAGILQIPLSHILRSIQVISAPAGRMQRCTQHDDQPKVIVDFAHTPDALAQVLAALRLHCKGRLWCVMGCGGDRDQGKRSVMGAEAERLADKVIITNDNPRFEEPKKIIDDILRGIKRPEQVKVEMDRVAAITYAIEQASTDDIVLIAGKGHEVYQEIQGKRMAYSDVQTVKDCLGV